MAKGKTISEETTIAGIPVLLVRKSVKRLSLSVLAPFGDVRVTAPLRYPTSELERFVSSRRGWILEKQAGFPKKPSSERRYESGEYVFLWGERLPLTASVGRSRVSLGQDGVTLACPSTDPQKRAATLASFYRREVAREAADLLPSLVALTSLSPKTLTVRKMKRRWGTCYHRSGTINLSLSLAEYPRECLAYVLLHELLHLRYPNHGAGFYSALQTYMPDYRARADLLTRYARRTQAEWSDC